MTDSRVSPQSAGAESERRLLAALCQNAVDATTRRSILQRLKNHAFATPDHEVIYRALLRIAPADATDLREALTQAVTRLGFPDVDLDPLFDPPKPTEEEITALLDRI